MPQDGSVQLRQVPLHPAPVGEFNAPGAVELRADGQAADAAFEHAPAIHAPQARRAFEQHMTCGRMMRNLQSVMMAESSSGLAATADKSET